MYNESKNNTTENLIRIILYIVFDILLLLSIFTDKIGWISIIMSEAIYPLLGVGLYIIPFLILYRILIRLGILSESTNRDKIASISILLFVNFILFSILYISKYSDIVYQNDFYQNIQQIYSVPKGELHGGLLGFIIVSTTYNIFGVTGANILYFAFFLLGVLIFIFTLNSSYTLSINNNNIDNRHIEKTNYTTQKSFIPQQSNYNTGKSFPPQQINYCNNNPYSFQQNNQKVVYPKQNNIAHSTTENINTSTYNKPTKSNYPIQSHSNNKPTNENTKTISANSKVINLLNKNNVNVSASQKQHVSRSAELLETTLLSFGIEAKVRNCIIGPSVTRLELVPKNGTKVSKIVNLSDDIALKLSAPSVRIEAPVPGQPVVGIEIPNQTSTPVLIRELLQSEEFSSTSNLISLAIGKDILGKTEIGDLTKMPHLLIAGSTGSGKSVCINSLILGLLSKYSAEEIKMILIDPKVVELSSYNKIPHLLAPVVTESDKAVNALEWLVEEMERRYVTLSRYGAKNIQSYNEKYAKDYNLEKMPYIILVIDELADLMMVASKEIETYICRLTQKSRAAGIHLIIATQRPSVDVITGLIKSNIPSRIAFAVSSSIDSRTILDRSGAEHLLGKGDMLYYPVGTNKPIRIQGSFVSEDEINKVVNYISSDYNEIKFDEDLVEFISKENSEEKNTNDLIKKAKDIVIKKQKASIGFLQQELKIGHPKASEILNILEEQGVVSEKNGNRPREVLISDADIE